MQQAVPHILLVREGSVKMVIFIGAIADFFDWKLSKMRYRQHEKWCAIKKSWWVDTISWQLIMNIKQYWTFENYYYYWGNCKWNEENFYGITSLYSNPVIAACWIQLLINDRVMIIQSVMIFMPWGWKILFS